MGANQTVFSLVDSFRLDLSPEEIRQGEAINARAIAQEKLEGLVGNYQAAFTTGVSQMFLVAAIILLLAAILIWFTFRSDPKTSPTQPSDSPELLHDL